MTTYSFEEQDKATLVDEVSRITQAAVDAGKSYRVQMSKIGDWWTAIVTVGEAAS